MSVSVTTREPRSGEVDGRDYLFVDAEAFTRMVAEGRFLEWAEVFGHRYGTPLAPIETVVSAGRDAVLEIDVQGAGIVREKVPGAVLVFLVPPSREELARRLRARGTEDDPELEARLAAVDQEMSERDRFDRVVVNDDLQRAVDQVAAIILEPTSGDPERKTP